MKSDVSLVAVGQASGLFLAITFSLCVGFDFLFPVHAMYEAWQKLLPGFEWLSWQRFIPGLTGSYGYGWYFALVGVPLHNAFAARCSRGSKPKFE